MQSLIDFCPKKIHKEPTAHEKILNINSLQENENQKPNKIPHHPIRRAIVKEKMTKVDKKMFKLSPHTLLVRT